MLSWAALTKCSVLSTIRALPSFCDCTELRSGNEEIMIAEAVRLPLLGVRGQQSLKAIMSMKKPLMI